MVFQTITSLVIGAANIAFWWFAMTRGQERFRKRCERRYDVTIAIAGRGFWSVSGGSWLRRFWIESLQFIYIMSLFVIWAGAILVVVFVSGFMRTP